MIADIDSSCFDFASARKFFSNDSTILLGIRRNGENVLLPDPGFRLEPGDRAVLVGSQRPAA